MGVHAATLAGRSARCYTGEMRLESRETEAGSGCCSRYSGVRSSVGAGAHAGLIVWGKRRGKRFTAVALMSVNVKIHGGTGWSLCTKLAKIVDRTRGCVFDREGRPESRRPCEVEVHAGDERRGGG